MATALHDNCKAVLVGEKTFGKVGWYIFVNMPRRYYMPVSHLFSVLAGINPIGV